jgi:histidinol-phosphatase (PHP family)
MMLNLADYHMHTKRCGHAEGEMEEYVEVAIQRGLREMGFSDHLPLVTHRVPTLTMGEEELPLYVEEVLQLRKQFHGFPIRLGIEADYVPGYEEKTQKLLEPYPWDYIIGSVHIIGQWEFDDPKRLKEWDHRNVDEVYHDYFELLRKSAQCSLFDIIAHSDLVKKFGHRASEDMREEIEETARVFKETGTVMEINTAGLRKPVREMYPAAWILETYRRHDLPLIISSDAHKPEEVGQDFGRAIRMALDAGYEDVVTFERRKISARWPLPKAAALTK